jgi:hypothetical protein
MSSPATGSLYSVGTFALLAGAFVLATGQLFGWAPVPSDNRMQATALLMWYAIAGYYALLVGRHRDATYLVALRRGLIDLGRALKGMVMR